MPDTSNVTTNDRNNNSDITEIIGTKEYISSIPEETTPLLPQSIEITTITYQESSPIEDFEYTINEDGVTITKYIGSGGNVVIPAEIEGVPVVSIGGYPVLFQTNNGGNEVIVGAFYNCESLISVTIPENVSSLGNWAFYGCTSLISIKIPNSVTSIGSSAFCMCYSLVSVTIPDSVTSIGDRAFILCHSLTSVTIPDSVTSIGNGAFYYCTSLNNITIPNGVTNIGNHAFYGCPLPNEIVQTVMQINSYAFYDYPPQP